MSGTIQSDDDQDWFSFSAVAGRAYRLQLSAAKRIEVLNENGESLLLLMESDKAVWVSPSDGTFFISLSHGIDDSPYELLLDVPIGDANLDGRFDSADLVAIFTANEFEDQVAGNSTWREGDWNGDGEFTTADLVLAFTSDEYVDAAFAIDSLEKLLDRAGEFGGN